LAEGSIISTYCVTFELTTDLPPTRISIGFLSTRRASPSILKNKKVREKKARRDLHNYLAVKRRRKERDLLVRTGIVDDLHDLGLEASVQQAIGLV